MKKTVRKVGNWIKENPISIIVLIFSVIIFICTRKMVTKRKLRILIEGAIIVLDVIYFLPELVRLITHKKKKKRTKKQKRTLRKRILIVIFSIIAMMLLAAMVFMFMIVKNAPDFDPDRLYKKESSILYDKNGNIYAKIGSEKRENITYDQMPEVLIDAIVATEDSRFFQHNGFDLPRFMVASAKQLLGDSSAGGASTLTMQLNKNNYTSTTASGWEGIIRKFTDIYMAIFKIEKQYTKKEIIEFYANSNYLGAGAHGVEQASLTYFGKHAKDLNLSEAAMIAGLFNAPSSLDPTMYPERAEERRLVVLSLMERHGYITKEEREIAKKITVQKMLVQNTETANEHQSFINTVTKEVLENTGNNPYDVPMEIYTTMDPEKQQYIDDIFAGKTDYEWENDKVQAGVAVVSVEDGSIVAISGGRNRNSAFGYSFATDIDRHIGSTAKPLYDYGPGIEYQNWSTYTPFTDEPWQYKNGTSIDNWNRTYEGFRTLREALRVSRNIPALKAFQKNENSNIVKFVTALGLHPEIAEDGSIHESHALGGYNGENPLSMASAYAAFGNGGYYNQPHAVTKIVYRQSDETWEYKVKKTRVMSEETAYMVANLLVSSGQYGLGAYNYINGAEFGAKSGTSNYDSETIELHNYPNNAVNDLWVSGTNAKYAIALWYGYEEAEDGYTNTLNTQNHRQLYQKIAKNFYENGVTFKRPSNVISVEVELESYPAKLPSEYTPSDKRVTELFKKGTEPTEVSKRFSAPEAPTSLNASANKGVITLTWEASPTPWGLDQQNANALGAELFGNETQRNYFVNSYLNYNQNVLGSLLYKIYYKNSDGSLSLIATSQENKTSFKIQSTDASQTYVVKAGYTNSGIESDGAEVTYKLDDSDFIITSELNGKETMSLKVGETFKDPSVSVTENGIDVTSKATITTKITQASKEVETIDTSKEGTYTITYSVKYKDYTDTHTRTVVIEKGEN